MDSVTQIALGAGVAEAVLGRKVGNKAALVGAVCGTLPDLDSFIPYADAVATVTYHRSWSHSVFVLTLLSPLIAWIVHRWLHASAATFRQWWLLVFLVLVTHPLLDCFTVYGTQILWPFVEHPYSGSTVFIIDPAYTAPLALGVLLALVMRRESRGRLISNSAGLTLSSIYLLWSVGAKFYVEDRVREQLAAQDIAWDAMLSTPAPFNTILWRFVIMAQGGYYEAYYSVLDAPHETEFVFHPDEKHLLEPVRAHWPVQRLEWFTHGYYAVSRKEDALVVADLRMGVSPSYNFTYKVAEFSGEDIVPVDSTLLPVAFNTERLNELMRRAFTPVR